MRKMAILLILLGITLMVYPTVNRWFEDREQQELLRLWEAAAMSSESVNEQEQTVIPIADSTTVNPARTLEQLNLERKEPQISENIHVEELPKERPKEPLRLVSNAPVTKAPNPAKPKVIGIIKIDEIQLKLPVVGDVTEKNLKVAPGHIPGTAFPGEIGNAAIAGHRSYSYGRMFNRLEELSIGGKIIIEAGGQKYEYIIYDKKMVDPADVSVLNHNNKDKLLTLITCDETGNRRLILHAKLH